MFGDIFWSVSNDRKINVKWFFDAIDIWKYLLLFLELFVVYRLPFKGNLDSASANIIFHLFMYSISGLYY